MKGDLDYSKLIVLILIPLCQYLTEKVSRNHENRDLYNTVYQLDLIDVYGIPHLGRSECMVFSSAYVFSQIHHLLGHNIILNEFPRTKIIQTMYVL